MRLAYLLNSYPMTSTTFIRREIAAIEAAGMPVKRFAVRQWDEPLVDPRDIAEQHRTEYLLTRNLGMLFAGAVVALLTRPRAVFAALPALRSLIACAGGGWVRHIAYLLQAIRLQTRCAALGIDHLHAHFSTNAAAVAMLCRLMGGPRYSFTVHGPDELLNPHAADIVAKARHAAAIVAISSYCSEKLHELLPESGWPRIEIIPCGLNMCEFPHIAPLAAGPLLCVGRLCAEKGQVEIPAAVAALAPRFPGLEIVLVGDGPMRASIEAGIAGWGLGDRVRLLGWRSNAEVRELIAASRALLLPSHAEGLPIVIMEAFALGRPAITTRVAAIPELVDAETGWLCDPGDGEGLEAAIAAALAASPDQLAAMGREGRRRVEERHDLASIAPRLIALFGQDDPVSNA
jgi:colanic acid/amylovoran biosynthesis glycosyltransferase